MIFKYDSEDVLTDVYERPAASAGKDLLAAKNARVCETFVVCPICGNPTTLKVSLEE